MKEYFFLALSLLFLFSGCVETPSVTKDEELRADHDREFDSSECNSSYIRCETTEEIETRINDRFGINDTYKMDYIECDFYTSGGERMTGKGTFADDKTFEFYYENYGYSSSGGHGFETCFSMNSDEKDPRFKSASYKICGSLRSQDIDYTDGHLRFDNTTETISYCMDGGYNIKGHNGAAISAIQRQRRASESVGLGSVPCYRGSKINDLKAFQEACAKAKQLNDTSIICSLVRNKYLQEECLDHTIEETNDSSVCGKMSFGKDYCYQEVSIRNKDLSLCGKISDKEQRDDCYVGDFRGHKSQPQSDSLSYDGPTGRFKSRFTSFYANEMTIKEIKIADKLDPRVSCKAVYEPDLRVESEDTFSVDAQCSGGAALKKKGEPYELEIFFKYSGEHYDNGVEYVTGDHQENGTLRGEAD